MEFLIAMGTTPALRKYFI